MISLRDGTPLVELPDGRNTSFDKCWITSSIQLAAENAGYHRWWLAEHIAESVSVYLQRDFENNAVPVSNLKQAVVEVLESVGFQDVAAHFQLPDPPVRLSLSELVQEAGDGYELAFFGLLANRLQSVSGSRTMRIEIQDLTACLHLLSRKRQRLERNGLREEIVGFIRQHGQSIGSKRRDAPLEIQLR